MNSHSKPFPTEFKVSQFFFLKKKKKKKKNKQKTKKQSLPVQYSRTFMKALQHEKE